MLRQDLIVNDPFSSANPKNQQGGRWNRLHLLDPADPDFANVEKQFMEGWQHKHKRRPQIKAAFKIVSPPSFHMPYFQYRDRVAEDLSGIQRTVSSCNEQLLFHGTNRACSLGEDRSSIYLCTLSECHMCCIIRHSFDIRKCGTKNKFRRFGTGIYVTSVSSKADDYTQNVKGTATARALLLNRVIVGNPKRRVRNAVTLTAPPPGYHSVIGEPGIDLNYGETVVYNNDAIRPAFLIIYGEVVEPPQPKAKLQAAIRMLFQTPIAT